MRITREVTYELKPWQVPNFAIVVPTAPYVVGTEDQSGIPVKDLKPTELLELAGAWLTGLYRKAERPAPDLEKILRIGEQMAILCHNAAQSDNVAQPFRERMAHLYKQWDCARGSTVPAPAE